MRLVFVIGIPATLGLLLLAQPLIISLFYYGEFTELDVTMSGMSLMAYSFGLLGFILVKILAPAFYARKDMKTPVKVAIIALVSNIVLNLIFIGPFAHVGLAAATAISAFINSGLLYWYITKQGVFAPMPGWTKLLMQLGFANLMLVGFIALISPATAEWLSFEAWQRMSWLMGLVFGAIVIYGVSLLLVGLNPKRLITKT